MHERCDASGRLRSSVRVFRLSVCVAVAAGVLAGSSPASAATAGVTSEFAGVTTLFYRAAPGEVNNVAVRQTTLGSYDITDTGATITTGSGCTLVDPHNVSCAATQLAVLTDDQDDRISAALVKNPSPLSLESTSGAAVIFAGTGNDTVTLSVTGRLLQGSGGSDFTRTGLFLGTFSVDGGPGDDVITGSADHDILEGGPGNDALFGMGGNDVLAGGLGDDSLAGGPGDDFLLGSDLEAFELRTAQPADHDILAGEDGTDLLAGGPGPDTISGGAGKDTLLYAQSLSATPRPPAAVSVSFDGQANDGPRGEGDNVPQADVESAISLASGSFSVSGSLALRGGTYALVGGHSTRATIILLSERGTPAAQSGTFAGSSFTVHAGARTGPVTEVRATGGSFGGCVAHTAIRDAWPLERNSARGSSAP